MLEDRRRAVITGVGIISPIGIGKENVWKATIDGQSATDFVSFFDPSPFNSQIAAEVRDFEPRLYGLRDCEIRRMDRYVQFAVIASDMALKDARLAIDKLQSERVGVNIANAIGGTGLQEREFGLVSDYGRKTVDFNYVLPHLYQAAMFSTPSNEIAARYGFKNVCCTTSTGCTAGLDSLGFAFETIAAREADLMIAGASEAPLTPIAFAAFDVIGATSRDKRPKVASRPFDRTRNGFVLGEGAGVFVVESLEHALNRGAKIYAEILGYGTSCNAYHMTDLHKEGRDLANAISLALEDATVAPHSISYINSHGSSTPQNDVCETQAYKLALGDAAYRVPISSIKGHCGHALAAANGIEIAVGLLAMENNVLPATLNYEYPDPECDLDYIPNESREAEIDIMLKVASGFSGIHSAMVFKQGVVY